MRKLLVALLADAEIKAEAAPNAEEALALHQTEPFDLLLVDWTLPAMSGLELCRIVRDMPGGEDVVVVVITGRDRPEDLQAVMDAGASDYLSKPIDPESLRTRLLVAVRAVREAQQRKEMRSRLLLADRMASVGTLAAGVAHELNNPLAYVLSNLSLTIEEFTQAEEGWLERSKEQIEEAIHGAARMRNIVRDLKTFSRSDDKVRQTVALKEVLESSISMCWNEMRHKCTLERDIGQTPYVEANESRLGQVFLNLLINASQAIVTDDIHANRIIVRSFTDEAGDAVVQVGDNGVGIPETHLERIFDPFFTTKQQFEGTGLGLAICRNLVTAEGGEISVESEVGKGTTFEVRLPASKRRPRKKQTLMPPAASPGPRAKIIVIDDEALVGASIRRSLRNHDVQVFSDPVEAIEVMRSGKPIDMVLCDIMMPEMSGMEVFAIIDQERPELAERFVFITGGAFTEQARAFLEATPVLCIDKPFDVSQLRDLVRERMTTSG